MAISRRSRKISMVLFPVLACAAFLFFFLYEPPCAIAAGSVEDRLIKYISTTFDVDAKTLHKGTDLCKDLRISERDFIEYAMAVGEEFNIEVEDKDYTMIRTIGDAKDYVVRKRACKLKDIVSSTIISELGMPQYEFEMNKDLVAQNGASQQDMERIAQALDREFDTKIATADVNGFRSGQDFLQHFASKLPWKCPDTVRQ